MQGKNRHFRRSHLSEARFRVIIRSFALDLLASKLAELSRAARRLINYSWSHELGSPRFVTLHRPSLARLKSMNPILVRAVSVGGRVVEQAVKWLFSGSWNGKEKSNTEIVPAAAKKQLQAAIQGQVALDSSIHSDGWRGYNGLVDMKYKKHFRVHHGENVFARGNCRINGIESFWSYAKRRLAKFNGVPRQTFHSRLKECEFRFNHREENLSERILTLLRKNTL